LDDVGSGFSLTAFFVFVDDVVDLFKSFNNHNSISSVGVFTGLDEPSVSSLGLEAVLDLIVRIVLFGFFFFLNFLLSFVVLNQEVVKLFVSLFLDMESHGNVDEWILLFAFVISL
jgi:hypothetical protein